MAKNRDRSRKRLRIPTHELMDLIGTLLDAGNPREEIPKLVGQFFDDLVDFDELIDGPLGDALERIDGPVFVAAAKLILSLVPEEKLIARVRVAA